MTVIETTQGRKGGGRKRKSRRRSKEEDLGKREHNVQPNLSGERKAGTGEQHEGEEKVQSTRAGAGAPGSLPEEAGAHVR